MILRFEIQSVSQRASRLMWPHKSKAKATPAKPITRIRWKYRWATTLLQHPRTAVQSKTAKTATVRECKQCRQAGDGMALKEAIILDILPLRWESTRDASTSHRRTRPTARSRVARSTSQEWTFPPCPPTAARFVISANCEGSGTLRISAVRLAHP